MNGSRVLLYSHDTFGLGHIRRTQKIANALSAPGRSILVACASPKASAFSSRPGIEHLNLPGFAKQVNGEYLPRNLFIPGSQFVNLRASLLLSAVRSFNPDLVLVDKEPLGVRGELLPALEHIRAHARGTRVICGFRDILDEPEAVAREWRERDTLHALRTYYDEIVVYGERAIYDFGREYALPSDIAARLNYVGYVHAERNLDNEELPFLFDAQLPVVTLTLGGGGDGSELMDGFLEAWSLVKNPGFHTILLTGPFAPPALLRKARRLAESRPGLESADFISNTRALFSRSDFVVSMGGYNTMCELAALRKRPLVVPRVLPRREQLLRARAFGRLGLCDWLEPEATDGPALLTAVQRRLNSPRIEAPAFATQGLDNLRERMEGVLTCAQN